MIRRSCAALVSLALILTQVAPAQAVRGARVTGAGANSGPRVPGKVVRTPAVPGQGGGRDVRLSGETLKSPSGVSPTVRPAAAAAAAPVAEPAPRTHAEITGAITRRYEDPGKIKKMWFVISGPEDVARSRDALERVRAANPGVEVVTYHESEVVPMRAGKKGPEPDQSAEAQKALFERILTEGAEFVLAGNPHTYEQFRRLRDFGYARELPFGFAGRRFVSVDFPRGSLDPGVLSDPRAYPHERWLYLTGSPGAGLPADDETGMKGSRASLEEALVRGGQEGEHGSIAEEIGWFKSLLSRVGMKLSGEADSRAMRRTREQAQRLAAYLEKERIDALATDDPRAAELLDEMKREGYHLSLPVLWTGREAPPVSAAILASGRPRLAEALRAAPRLERLPDNFGEMGGTAVSDYEPAVRDAIQKAVPPAPKGAPKKYQVHFLLTGGNGTLAKGDSNPFGHFGLAIEDEQGEVQVWTVQYMDERGGTFSGGLGKGSQLTLAEYLYQLWYLPGATGQPTPKGEVYGAPVLDFIVRNVDETALEDMRQAAAFINANHLTGKDSYEFVNKGGLTNCISMVTQILRSAGFPIAESGTQAPGDKAVEFIRGFGRWLLDNQIDPLDFGFALFERPAFSASHHYKLWNWTLGTPYLNHLKPWAEMSWGERIRTLLRRPFEFFGVARVIGEFAGMATHRVVVGPNSRAARVIENPDSPIARLRRSSEDRRRLRVERRPLQEELAREEAAALELMGLDGWQLNPGQTLEELGRERRAGMSAVAWGRLEAGLRRHHELDLRLSLNKFDEQIELRRIEFLKLQLADPMRRYARRLDPIRREYQRVLDYRDRVQLEGRVLTEAEVRELDRINAQVEERLEAVLHELRKDLGTAPPHDMRMIFRQISRGTLQQLKEVAAGGDPTGKDKGSSKK